jgi:Kef-type K+ transport system membrane component KefB
MFGLSQSQIKKDLDGIIGLPGQGVHSYRIFNVAYMDVIVVLVAAILIAWAMKWSYMRTIIGIFILGIIVHKALCVGTTVDKVLSTY